MSIPGMRGMLRDVPREAQRAALPGTGNEERDRIARTAALSESSSFFVKAEACSMSCAILASDSLIFVSKSLNCDIEWRSSARFC